MSAPYRLLGADLSPYTAKIRACLRYKGIEHTYVRRSAATEAEFQRHARLPLLPILIGSDDFSIQDSTPMLATLEERHPSPPAVPNDAGLAFLALLLEEYADEWAYKIMFRARWSQPDAAAELGRRIAADVLAEDAGDDRDASAQAFAERMTLRLGTVGATDANGAVLDASFVRLLRLLDGHLGQHVFLLGGRPSAGDFALAAQLGQMLGERATGALVRREGPHVAAWIEMTLDAPKAAGDWASFDDVAPTLMPFLVQEVAGTFLAWSRANAEAMRENAEEFSVDLDGGTWTQEPQKYPAKTLGELRRKRQELGSHARLDALLGEAGVDRVLRPA
jgi:glutathione S-transferase